MKKLKLRLETLKIETFDVTAMPSNRGTVIGGSAEFTYLTCGCALTSLCPPSGFSCNCVTPFCATPVRHCINTDTGAD